MDQTLTPTSTLIENRPITLDDAKDLSKKLIGFVNDNKLSANIAGKNYLYVEAWQFCGAVLGLTHIVRTCEQVAPMEDLKELKYRAVVDITNSQGVPISRGFAWCSNKEQKKKSFDEFAIASMAQTRAIGKAYRNQLSWIVKMAGYEATPLEEINDEHMEAELSKAKQNVLKALNKNGIIKGTEVMDYIRNVLDKNVIESIDDANKILRSLGDDSNTAN